MVAEVRYMSHTFNRLPDQSLTDVLGVTSLTTIEEVLAVMDAIDAALPPDDGIRWFNFLYRMVTAEVHACCQRGEWKNPEWMVCLDVEFAKLFFEAVHGWFTSRSGVPRAWCVLFEKRFDHRLSPVQFGLAGINAHINRDLPLAIVRAQEKVVSRRPEAGTEEEQDFTAVNVLLDKVELEALKQMATGWIKVASRTIDPIDKKAAMKAVSLARYRAWYHAGRYWDLIQQGSCLEADAYIRRLDRIAEGIGRGLLLPTYSR